MPEDDGNELRDDLLNDIFELLGLDDDRRAKFGPTIQDEIESAADVLPGDVHFEGDAELTGLLSMPFAAVFDRHPHQIQLACVLPGYRLVFLKRRDAAVRLNCFFDNFQSRIVGLSRVRRRTRKNYQHPTHQFAHLTFSNH